MTVSGASPERIGTERRESAALSCRCSRLASSSAGVVMMEFLIALLPVMLAFLGFTQFCFAGIAKLMVRHSAAMASRAAVVVLEESGELPGVKKDIYSGFIAGGLEIDRPDPKQKGSANVASSQAQVGQVTSGPNNGSKSKGRTMDVMGAADRSSTRIKQIRTAAYFPLLTVSPNLFDQGLSPDAVDKAIGGAGDIRALGALMYNMGAVAVTFPKDLKSKELTDGKFPANSLVTTRVTYLFRCQVPLAAALMCDSGWALLFGDAWFDPFAMSSIVRMVGKPPTRPEDVPAWTATWKNEKSVHDLRQKRVEAYLGHEKDFEQVEWPFMLDLLLAMPGARYMVLTAEAQLPLQSARYYPRMPTDADGDKKMEEMWKRQDEERKKQMQMPDVRETTRPAGQQVASAMQGFDNGVTQLQKGIDEIKSVSQVPGDLLKQGGSVIDPSSINPFSGGPSKGSPSNGAPSGSNPGNLNNPLGNIKPGPMNLGDF